ncbi:hypothetical protein G7Y89_g11420 [Cudoniella acicularis]|uniref:Uncharacterized protein n=1 Tax=Cudoniella acicularis TaxID=354080 RepID=A0A8H4REI9_9HELO|nr:hypothetical protein G7Y89_g11420 [Cudoniella acicularis]
MKSIFLLPAILHALRVSSAPAPAPAPYVVTSYIELSIYTESAFTGLSTTIPVSLYTHTIGVNPTVTPLSPITTYTDDSIYAHVSIVEIVLPAGEGQTPSYDYDLTATTTTTNMDYVVPITYKPAATCTGQSWSFVTNIPVTIPRIVQSQMVPVTTLTSATTYTYGDYNPTAYTSIIGVLNPTDVDASEVSYASSLYLPYEASYCATPTTYCTTPTAAASASCTVDWSYSDSTYNSGDGSQLFSDDTDNSWLVAVILIAVLVPVGWALIWLIIGFWESWMSFKGLMLGLQRKRGLPYAWCCISWIFLCFTGPTYKAKSAEEQVVLKERWAAMGAGEKFKLWLKWGFRWKYPEVLGEEPEIAKRAFRQGCL